MARMIDKNLTATVMAVVLLVAAVLACSGGDETDKANKLVDDGNAAVADAKKAVTDAQEKITTMMGTEVPPHLSDARNLANEAIRLYDQAQDKCKAAASKYDEASKLKIDDKFKDYLAAKTKEFNKRAEVVEALKSVPQALIDADDRNAFTSRANAANQKADSLGKEADDLAAQAEKIRTDNPNSFKK